VAILQTDVHFVLSSGPESGGRGSNDDCMHLQCVFSVEEQYIVLFPGLYPALCINQISLVLCSDAQVCCRWLQLCSLPELWRAHCSELGEKEGVGDLANAVEATSLASGGGRDGEKVGKEREVVIDWKRAYRDLSRVTARIKTLVVQAGVCVCALWGGGHRCDVSTPPSSYPSSLPFFLSPFLPSSFVHQPRQPLN